MGRGANQRVKGGRDNARPLTSNGEINAYSEKEDEASAGAKHESVHQPGDGGDGPQGGCKRARVALWQGIRAVKGGLAPTHRRGRGPTVGRKTRAVRTGYGEVASGPRI